MEDAHMDIPDKVLNLEGMLVTKESAEHVRRILDGMPNGTATCFALSSWKKKRKTSFAGKWGLIANT